MGNAHFLSVSTLQYSEKAMNNKYAEVIYSNNDLLASMNVRLVLKH